MHRALPKMLQSLHLPKSMQQEIFPHNEHQQLLSFINGENNNNDQTMSIFSQFHGMMSMDHHRGGAGELPMKQEEALVESAWNGFQENYVGYMMNYAIPRTISCPPAMTVVAMADSAVAAPSSKAKGVATLDNKTTSPKKRRVDKNQQQTQKKEEGKEKNMKGESRVTEKHSNGETSGDDASKENSKVSEAKKPDYIHVRARRGQATDSHSLAERVRREKINERMKFLQDLIPGCNKIVGKAEVLDEIINYVQSLQRQVEFLSMKLATFNPTTDINIDSFFPKEMFSAGLSPEIVNSVHDLPFDPLQQVVSCSGIETSADMTIRRTISAPVSVHETLLDQSCFNQIQHPSTWDANLHNLYAMEFEEEKSDSVSPLPFTGYVETNHVK